MASLKAEIENVHCSAVREKEKENEKEKLEANSGSVTQATTQATVSIGVTAPEQELTPVLNARTKKRHTIKKKDEPKESKDMKEDTSIKRQRLELLTQIKYTMVYDERVDKEPVDNFLKEYEKKMRS